MRKNYNKNVHETHNCTEKNTKKAVKFQLILYLEMHFSYLPELTQALILGVIKF